MSMESVEVAAVVVVAANFNDYLLPLPAPKRPKRRTMPRSRMRSAPAT